MPTLPRVILHNAVSLDGRFQGFPIDLRQFYGLAARWKEQATLIGADTILAAPDPVPPETDDAFEPPVVDPHDRRPLLVLVDSRGRVRTWHALRRWPFWRDHVALCAQRTPKEHLAYLRARHIKYIVAGRDRVNLRAALRALRTRFGVKTVRADCGGTLNGALLRAGLVNEVSALVHPHLVGGATPLSLFREPDPDTGKSPIRLSVAHVEKLKGGAVWLRYRVRR